MDQISPPLFEPLSTHREYPPEEMLARSNAFAEELHRRRTVRQFSPREVSTEVIRACIRAASSAPSGANQQPWHFVVVQDPGIKQAIRVEAERAEQEFYASAPAEWLAALAPLGTDQHKPYLEVAPYIIAIFAQRYSLSPEGRRRHNYYVMESVGIAAGMLIAALHHAGLATLTHTPNPMHFLNRILHRPANERPVMLVVTGFPAADALVPRIGRKPVDEVSTFL
jgi:iodotyrosine deiodinase